MSDKPSFFAELKRRNVYKVAVAYAVVAWLLIQAASILFPVLRNSELGDQAFACAHLLGFPIALILAWAFEFTPEGMKLTESANQFPSKPRRSRVWIYVVMVSGVISTVCSFSAATLHRLGSARGKPTRSNKSIAVLPFENLSDDKANAYFATGIQDEIMTRLSKIADLKVISRTSTQQYQSKPDTSRKSLTSSASRMCWKEACRRQATKCE